MCVFREYFIRKGINKKNVKGGTTALKTLCPKAT